MATTTTSDVKLYDRQFYGGYIETIQQNVDAFNQASRGAIVLRNRILPSSYEKQSFFDQVAAISRRDPTADSSNTASPTKLTMDEFIGVKLNRRNGPYEWNISAAKQGGFDAREFSRAIGVQTAQVQPQEQLDRALGALEAKLDGTSALEHDISSDSPGTLTTDALIKALKKFGDAARNIRLWVMHSHNFYDLVAHQMASQASVYASDRLGAELFAGMPVTLGRPVLVTDSAALVNSVDDPSSGVDKYSVLGLTDAAAVLDLSEAPIAVAEGPRTGSDNLYITWQAEYAYNLSLKGCAYNTGTGTNPTNANVATASSWTTKVASDKLLPGVIIKAL
jgi:hypothetical protein